MKCTVSKYRSSAGHAIELKESGAPQAVAIQFIHDHGSQLPTPGSLTHSFREVPGFFYVHRISFQENVAKEGRPMFNPQSDRREFNPGPPGIQSEILPTALTRLFVSKLSSLQQQLLPLSLFVSLFPLISFFPVVV